MSLSQILGIKFLIVAVVVVVPLKQCRLDDKLKNNMDYLINHLNIGGLYEINPHDGYRES